MKFYYSINVLHDLFFFLTFQIKRGKNYVEKIGREIRRKKIFDLKIKLLFH